LARLEKPLAVFCADIGSVSAGKFGWAGGAINAGHYDLDSGSNISLLAEVVAGKLNDSVPVALGFECPLFVPISDDPARLTSARKGEGRRPWSAGAGSGVLATGLTETVWILRRIRQRLTSPVSAYLEWPLFDHEGRGLFLWEAFVSDVGKGESTTHVGDAEIAVLKFIDSLPNPHEEDAIESDEVHSLLGAALLRTGWTANLSVLTKPCLVIKA